nr:hypothetical protein Iba_chr02bCG16570 [Ipomoea batatas]
MEDENDDDMATIFWSVLFSFSSDSSETFRRWRAERIRQRRQRETLRRRRRMRGEVQHGDVRAEANIRDVAKLAQVKDDIEKMKEDDNGKEEKKMSVGSQESYPAKRRGEESRKKFETDLENDFPHSKRRGSHFPPNDREIIFPN